MRGVLFVVFSVLLLSGCYVMRTGTGGGNAPLHSQVLPGRRVDERPINTEDIALPSGYRIDALATGLTFPTGVTTDDQARVYVVESGYSYGEVWTTPRLIRIETDGKTTQIAAGTNGPWTGVDFHDGAFYVAEGGEMSGGRI